MGKWLAVFTPYRQPLQSQLQCVDIKHATLLHVLLNYSRSENKPEAAILAHLTNTRVSTGTSYHPDASCHPSFLPSQSTSNFKYLSTPATFPLIHDTQVFKLRTPYQETSLGNKTWTIITDLPENRHHCLMTLLFEYAEGILH